MQFSGDSSARRLSKAAPLASMLFSLLIFSLVAGVSAGELTSQRELQIRLARNFEVYDFEPRPGRIDSRDADHDGIPDYWRKLRGPAYLDYEKVLIVPDPNRPGWDPTGPGHVLAMTYSGGGEVSAETTIPRIIDPQLSQEISAFARIQGLDHSIVTVEAVWLHIDPQGKEEILGEPSRIIVPPGQVDWPEAPLRLRVNNLPRRTTHVRMVCRIRDNPEIPGADRHGEAWFDDIRIVSRPKITVNSVFQDDEEPLRIIIGYQGLKANAPGAPGSKVLTEKKYERRITVKDLYGNVIWPEAGSPSAASLVGGALRKLNPGDSAAYTEEIVLNNRLPDSLTPRRKRGVFYLRVTLYGEARQPLASVMAVVGRWAPPPERSRSEQAPKALENFAINLDPNTFPKNLENATIINIFRHLGIFRAKVEVWGDYGGAGLIASKRRQDLTRLLRKLGALGIRFTGDFGRLPETLVPVKNMLPAMREHLDKLEPGINRIALELSPRIDDWQWGRDDDLSFGQGVTGKMIAASRQALREFTSSLTQALPVTLGSAMELPEAQAAEAVNIYVPAYTSTDTMLAGLVKLLPHQFTALTKAERLLFLPDDLQALARQAAADLAAKKLPLYRDENGAKQNFWLSLQPRPLDPGKREAAGERLQAIMLARKAILGRALGFDRVFLGDLTDPERGAAVVTHDGDLVPRPSLLVLQTLARYLSGGEYLGSFQLGANIRNYLFRSLDNPDEAILAAWSSGLSSRPETLNLGLGMGSLARIDMAGNTRKIKNIFTITPMPILLTGINVKAARTRMSIRIKEIPPLLSKVEQQQQVLSIYNFHNEPLLGTVRLVYAAYQEKARMRFEPGWTSPPVLRLNLPPGGESLAKLAKMEYPYIVRPTQESSLGRKYVRLEVHLAAAKEMHFNLIRSTNLTSDLAMRVKPLPTAGPRQEYILRLMIAWRPDPSHAQTERLVLRPYYQVAADQHIYQGRIVVYPVRAGEGWKDATVRDIYIPRAFQNRRIWIGADEDNGSRFIRQEVTGVLRGYAKGKE